MKLYTLHYITLSHITLCCYPTLTCITLYEYCLTYITLHYVTFPCLILHCQHHYLSLPYIAITFHSWHHLALSYIMLHILYMHIYIDACTLRCIYKYVYTYFQKCISQQSQSLSLFIWVFFDLLMVLLTKSQKHTGPNRHLSASDVLSQASDWSLPTGFLVKAAVEVIRIAFGRRAEKAV